MKEDKVYMQDWLNEHPRIHILESDKWYVDFANRLLPVVANSSFYEGFSMFVCKKVTVMLAYYFEDSVANDGGWRYFSDRFFELYGKRLPFYTIGDDYIEDEVNMFDIAFLLWSFSSGPVEDADAYIENPFDEDLLALAREVCSFMEQEFDLAPITDGPTKRWVSDPGQMEKESRPLPALEPGEKLPVNVERFMVASGGKDLMYFDTYQTMRDFFVRDLGWDDDEESLMPEMKNIENFVLYANPKGLLMGLEVAPYFNDPDNSLYDPALAESEGYLLFCEPGVCPFDLLKYAMAHNLMSDVAFPFENGKELFHNDWDFMARWCLGEYYEGD